MPDKNKSKTKYSGKDSVTWIIADSSGKQIGKQADESYGTIAAAARAHTAETGNYAAPKRQ